MTAEIAVRARFVGFHAWPDAPPLRSYLASRHRHEFHVELRARVTHDDRQIEFHDLKDHLSESLPDRNEELGAMSCEMIARRLLDRLDDRYGDALLWCEVWEDGEVGARVYGRGASC